MVRDLHDWVREIRDDLREAEDEGMFAFDRRRSTNIEDATASTKKIKGNKRKKAASKNRLV